MSHGRDYTCSLLDAIPVLNPRDRRPRSCTTHTDPSGNPVPVAFDGNDVPVNDAVKARLNASLGVDGPLHIQYFKHMWGVLHFDFDVPFQSPGETVLELLAPQMVSIPVTRCDPKTLQQALIQRYSNEIPCFNWQDHTVVRLSAQGYNTLTDMDLLITALTDLLPELSAMT